jgi:hypothetical protein
MADKFQVTPENATEVSDAAKAAAPKSESTPAAPQRPEWCPEQFWKDGKVDQEGLGKSYGELRTKMDGGKQPETKPDPTPETKPEEKKEEAPAVMVPGVSQEQMGKFTAELQKDGKLSDASYGELAKLGYGKQFVDAYVKGLTADATTKQAVESARIADTEISAIKSSIGGDAELAAMIAWGKANLTPQELAEYNGAVTSSDPAKVKLAVTGLHALYRKEVGSDPRLLGGRPGSGAESDVYTSKEQMMEDMQNPKYDKDPAFRAKVAAKLGRSKII